MDRKVLRFIFITLLVTLVLLPNFYRNRWGVVETVRYEDWQTRYDRLVIARLVKTRQDGFLSASGLLGLGDVQEWNYLSRTNRRQFNAYLKGDTFKTYFVYKSNPGFQGVLYGLLDQLPVSNPALKLKLFRGFTALASALVFGLIIAVSTRVFGWLSGALVLFFSAFSAWTILPAGTIFYNYWCFYLPPLLTTYLLVVSEKNKQFEGNKIFTAIFVTVLLKILLSGFDFVTTVIVMTTVPFVFFGIYHQWGWRLLLNRLIKAGVVLLAAAVTGLLILLLQIATEAGGWENASGHILDRLAIYTVQSPTLFGEVDTSPEAQASTLSVTASYFVIPALEFQAGALSMQVLYWHLVLIFLVFSVVFFYKYRLATQAFPDKGLALLAATWYSILAPLSWFIIFKKHSYIHTHVNPIIWQMPFTLLGLVLCGFVIMELFKPKLQTLSD